jgi:hypothetical protein
VSEHETLRRGFLIGLLATGIVFVLLGGLIAAFATTDDRPEGVAERWLTAVGDTTRSGVKADSLARVADHGDPSLVAVLVPPAIDMDGKSAFTELEVGKAIHRDGVTLVPYHLALREGTTTAGDGTLSMVEDPSRGWLVTALTPAVSGATVPSKGGSPVSKAPFALYAVALAIGALVATGCASLVRAAGAPTAARARSDAAAALRSQ